jgi:hypothetical protein
VTEQERTPECIRQIKELVEAQPPTTITLYRGHTGGESIINDAAWWSTSSSKTVANSEFSKNSGSIFMIHVTNVPVLDVNRYANENGFLADLKEYASECEYILLGGGTFYDSRNMTSVGFHNHNGREYSTWYRIEPRAHVFTNEEVIRRALNRVSGMEDMINDDNDLNPYINDLLLTKGQKDTIMKHILSTKNVKNGGTRRKRCKHSKRHSRRLKAYMY